MDHLFKIDMKGLERSSRISRSVSKLRTKKPVLFQINHDKESISQTPLKMMEKRDGREQHQGESEGRGHTASETFLR